MSFAFGSMRPLLVVALALVALQCCITIADAHVVIAEYKPHVYKDDMKKTMIRNIEDAMNIAVLAKKMGGTVLILPEWMFISSSYMFFPNYKWRWMAQLHQYTRIKEGVKIGVIRFKELVGTNWTKVCADLAAKQIPWELKYVRCIAQNAGIDLVAMSFTEHDPTPGHVPARAKTNIYNSLLYMRHDSELILVYDKVHLINHEAPWLLFGAGLDKITDRDLHAFGPQGEVSMTSSSSRSGSRKFGNVLNLRVAGRTERVGLLICYDVMFPDTLSLLIKHDPAIKTFLVVTQWGNLNALWGVTIQQGVARANNVTIMAANINTDAEAPDRETGSGWYVGGLPALHTMGRIDETVIAARMKMDPEEEDDDKDEAEVEGSQTASSSQSRISFRQFSNSYRKYAVYYSNEDDKKNNEGRALLMTLNNPADWMAKKAATVQKYFDDDDMRDVKDLDEFYDTVEGMVKGAALSLNESYIITDPNTCAHFKALVAKKPGSRTHSVHCLGTDPITQTLKTKDLTCKFDLLASSVGKNDIFVVQAVVVAKRKPAAGKPDAGDRYSRGCLFYAVKPLKEAASCKISKLQDLPRGRDMTYLVDVKTKWEHVKVANDVRGKNIATIPLTGVLKSYRSQAAGESGKRFVRVVPLTTRTGCKSSWKKLTGEAAKGFKKGATELTVSSTKGKRGGCSAVDVSLYGTGIEPRMLKGVDDLMSGEVSLLRASSSAALFEKLDKAGSINELSDASTTSTRSSFMLRSASSLMAEDAITDGNGSDYDPFSEDSIDDLLAGSTDSVYDSVCSDGGSGSSSSSKSSSRSSSSSSLNPPKV